MNYVIVLVFVAIMKIQQDDVFGNDHGKAGFQGKASQEDDHVIMMVIMMVMMVIMMVKVMMMIMMVMMVIMMILVMIMASQDTRARLIVMMIMVVIRWLL